MDWITNPPLNQLDSNTEELENKFSKEELIIAKSILEYIHKYYECLCSTHDYIIVLEIIQKWREYKC
jgi:hypothetical protein